MISLDAVEHAISDAALAKLRIVERLSVSRRQIFGIKIRDAVKTYIQLKHDEADEGGGAAIRGLKASVARAIRLLNRKTARPKEVKAALDDIRRRIAGLSPAAKELLVESISDPTAFDDGELRSALETVLAAVEGRSSSFPQGRRRKAPERYLYSLLVVAWGSASRGNRAVSTSADFIELCDVVRSAAELTDFHPESVERADRRGRIKDDFGDLESNEAD